MDYVEDNFLNTSVDGLLHEYSNFTRTNIYLFGIMSRASISNHIQVWRWNVTLITHPRQVPQVQWSSWGPAVEWSFSPCLLFNGFVRTRVLMMYHMECILRIVQRFPSVEVLVCRRFGLSTFWFVDVSVCRRFGLSTFWFVDVLDCRRFGLSTFRFVDVLVCRRFGLSTFRFVDVLVVDVSVCRRFD